MPCRVLTCIPGPSAYQMPVAALIPSGDNQKPSGCGLMSLEVTVTPSLISIGLKGGLGDLFFKEMLGAET